MKGLLIILFLVACGQSLLADEPPCWCEFSIKSNNNLFRAEIRFSLEDSLLKPYERNWTINVYKTKPETSLKWSSVFHHDGYGGGVLSDDGQIYVYINDWLAMEQPPIQVIIYTQNKTHRFSGKDLKLNPTLYPNTLSHQIWMETFQLIPNYLEDSTYLRIKTYNSKEITIDVKSAKIKYSIASPLFTKENNILIKYTIGIIVFIGLGVLLIGLKT